VFGGHFSPFAAWPLCSSDTYRHTHRAAEWPQEWMEGDLFMGPLQCGLAAGDWRRWIQSRGLKPGPMSTIKWFQKEWERDKERDGQLEKG